MKWAMLGFGTVGQAVWHQAQRQRKSFSLGRVLVRHSDHYRQFKQVDLVTDPQLIIEDPDVETVVEVMGGLHPAAEYISACLQRGKNVVTANKALLARQLPQLQRLAQTHHCHLCFEASVGGGIPVIHTLRDLVRRDRVLAIDGILNGTSNYVLTAMQQGGLSFQQALQEAQQKGYAERGSDLDLTGWDAANKLVILADLAFHQFYPVDKVARTAITDDLDVGKAAKHNQVLKQVGHVSIDQGQLNVRVALDHLPASDLPAHVDGVTNWIQLTTEHLGKFSLMGPGAGGDATANSIWQDLLWLSCSQK